MQKSGRTCQELIRSSLLGPLTRLESLPGQQKPWPKGIQCIVPKVGRHRVCALLFFRDVTDDLARPGRRLAHHVKKCPSPPSRGRRLKLTEDLVGELKAIRESHVWTRRCVLFSARDFACKFQICAGRRVDCAELHLPA